MSMNYELLVFTSLTNFSYIFTESNREDTNDAFTSVKGGSETFVQERGEFPMFILYRGIAVFGINA